MLDATTHDRKLVRLHRPLLIITEGVLDIACLTRFWRVVRTDCTDLPDLEQLSAQGDVVFLPAGGGDLSSWTTKLAPLGCPEYFLCDREQQPETGIRESIVNRINLRPGCCAALTRKRALENYLHPAAISATFGVSIEVTDETPVAESVARSLPEMGPLWASMSHRQQQRFTYRIKRRLNTEVAESMTQELLCERDPDGEVVGWFRTIAGLLA